MQKLIVNSQTLEFIKSQKPDYMTQEQFDEHIEETFEELRPL